MSKDSRPPSIEDEAVKTTDYELTKQIVDQRMRAYVVYSAEEHQQTRQAMKHLETLVISTSPKRIWYVVDSVLTKAAVFLAFLFIKS